MENEKCLDRTNLKIFPNESSIVNEAIRTSFAHFFFLRKIFATQKHKTSKN